MIKNTEDEGELIKLEFNHPNIEKIDIYINESSFVQKEKKIGEYCIHNVKHSIISPIHGRVLKLDLEEKYLIIEICKHESRFKNLCTDCGFDIRFTEKKKIENSHNYIFMSHLVSFCDERAAKEEEKKVKKYLNEKKLFLLLDIDNTILHACSQRLTDEDYENLKSQYGYEIAGLKLGNNRMIIKLRPLLKEFLESIKDKYEIFLYTYGTQDYAMEIIKYINKTFEYAYLDPDKLVTRENNIFDCKNIKRIFPTTEDMVIIIDDRIDVWKNSKNLINVTPYLFFQDKMYPIKDKYTNNDQDRILYTISLLLKFINEIFYYYYTLHNKRIDVKIILEKKLNSIFNGKKFTLSGLYKKNTNISDTRQNWIIDILGGILEIDYSEEIDIVVTNKYVATEKINKAYNANKIIIHDIWLLYCYFFLIEINKEKFILTKERREINTTEINQVDTLEENKEIINKFYSLDEDKIKDFCEILEVESEIDEF